MIIPSQRPNPKARIEIVPLIDVIFFLLATFIMVSLSMIQNKGISVNLPVASTATPHKQEDPVTVSVTEKGEIYCNKQKVTMELLQEDLRSLKAREHDPKVLIHGDAQATLGDFTAVIDGIRTAGISKIAIQTKGASPTLP